MFRHYKRQWKIIEESMKCKKLISDIDGQLAEIERFEQEIDEAFKF